MSPPRGKAVLGSVRYRFAPWRASAFICWSKLHERKIEALGERLAAARVGSAGLGGERQLPDPIRFRLPARAKNNCLHRRRRVLPQRQTDLRRTVLGGASDPRAAPERPAGPGNFR